MITDRMRKKLNVAVIGVGNMGRHHARVYSKLKQVRLVAVADITPKKANQYKVKFYKDYLKLLKNEEVDLVSICVPIHLHFKVAYDCLKFNKHILIEKPITKSLLQAEKLIKLAMVKKLKLTVGHIERFNPAVIKLKQMIEANKLGKLKSLMFQRLGFAPPKDPLADVVLDMGIHDIDVANFLLKDRPQKILAVGKKNYADILLDYPKTSVHLQINWITPVKIRRMTVVGTKGYAELDYINQSLDFYQRQPQTTYDNYKQLVNLSKKSKTKIKIEKQEPLKLELESLVKAIKLNRQVDVTGEEAVLALKIALKISKMIK